MNVKRFLVLGVLGLFLVSMMGLVLGADVADEVAGATETATTGFLGIIKGVLEALLGSGIPLSRIFMSILLGMVVYSIIDGIFTAKAWINWAIAISITSISMLTITDEFIQVIMTQYGAMGATILTVIPFLIITLFSVRVKNLLVARATWLFYSFYYFAMYFIAWDTSVSNTEILLNMGAIAAGIILFFFVANIRKMVFKGKIEGYKERIGQARTVKKVDEAAARGTYRDTIESALGEKFD